MSLPVPTERRVRLPAILPPGVACFEQVGPPQGTLLAQEAALLGARVAGKRRTEFAAGRSCARRALMALGEEPTAILQGEAREPLWPPGIIGSITHCEGYCAAAAAFGRRYLSLGIDAEPNEHVAPEVLALFASERERTWLATRAGDESIRWSRLLFSVKESIYKAWYPLERRWLGFEDAEIEFELSPGLPAGKFQAFLRVPCTLCPSIIHGRFHASEDLLLSCAAIVA